MRRVLVTGATGFIGRRLCRALVDRGYEVAATRRPESDAGALADLDLEWVEADVLDGEAVRAAVDDRDAVFHFAGATLQTADAATVREVNVRGTDLVARAALDAGVDRLVFASTASTRPHAGETTAPDPVGAYQESKARAEDRIETYVDRGLDAVTVHPTMAFGPGDDRFTARLCRLATDPKMVAYLPGGACFVGVDDVADGTVAAMEAGEAGEHYLLGGENRTYREALATIADRADGRTPPIRVPATAIHAAGPVAGAVNAVLDARVFPFGTEMARIATRTHFYDDGRARRELGYDPAPFETHVDAALEWYRGR